MKFTSLPRGVPGTKASEGAAPRALWMDPAILRENAFWQYEAGKIVLGGAPSNAASEDTAHLIGIRDNRHLMTVAGSRAGKGVSVIIPNLLTYTGSVLVIDPKGENARETAERRGQGRGIEAGGMGHEVYVIDPFRTADVPEEYRAGFNPFEALDPDSDTFIDDCDGIADGLVMSEPGKGGSDGDHWINAARMVLRGFVAWVATWPEARSRDLNELRRLLYLPPDDTDEGEGFEGLLAEMSVSPEIAHGIPAETANALLGMGLRERGSVLSTVRNNIQFLSSPPMAATLSGTQRSVDLVKWKHGGASVYLCLPAGRLHTHSRFFRLFLNRLLAAIELDKREPEVPALIIMDEMHVLGRMAALETAAGLLAGFGVRLWSIWQDMSQLKDLYRDRWETFMGNAGLLQFFGVNDLTTLKYISERLGTSSVMSISQGEISEEQVALGFTGRSSSIQAAPLLSPEEVGYYFSRQSDNQLIFYPGADPVFARRVPYWDDVYTRVRK